jgi:hypothetical protein
VTEDGRGSRIAHQCLRGYIPIGVGSGLLSIFFLSLAPCHGLLSPHTPQFAILQQGMEIATPHFPVRSHIASLDFWRLGLLLQINKDCHGWPILACVNSLDLVFLSCPVLLLVQSLSLEKMRLPSTAQLVLGYAL